MFNLKLLAIAPFVFLVACTATGPADDGYENQNEWVDNGRLFDDETKTIYSSDRRDEKSAGEDEISASPNSEMNVTSYQQWRKAKENNTQEYQKFQHWQEFEAFHHWQQQQKAEK